MRFPVFAVLLLAPSAACLSVSANEVFVSGTLPDLSRASSFVVSSDGTFDPNGEYINLQLGQHNPVAPLTVLSLEFYGYTVWSSFLGGDGVPDFEIVLGPTPVNVQAIERTDFGPAVVSAPGFQVTGVQRIRVDFDPVVLRAGDQVLIRGLSAELEEFSMAKAIDALPDIEYQVYSTPTLAVQESVTIGESLYFSLFDSLQVIAEPNPGDFNGDDVVDNADLNLLLVNWGEEEVPPEWVNGFEAPVDNGELNALLVSWGAGATSVPEPATASLLLTAAVAQRRRRRAESC
ncbi:MAG: hypothetical protein AAFV43_09405 [Planctomycetota bacterium]